jgi:hypothetical protein
MLNGVHSGFENLKKLSRGKFSTASFHYFNFSCKLGFNSGSYSKLVKRDTRRLPLPSPKTFFPSKDITQPDHFLLHKEKLASYPFLFYHFT